MAQTFLVLLHARADNPIPLSFQSYKQSSFFKYKIIFTVREIEGICATHSKYAQIFAKLKKKR